MSTNTHTQKLHVYWCHDMEFFLLSTHWCFCVYSWVHIKGADDHCKHHTLQYGQIQRLAQKAPADSKCQSKSFFPSDSKRNLWLTEFGESSASTTPKVHVSICEVSTLWCVLAIFYRCFNTGVSPYLFSYLVVWRHQRCISLGDWLDQVWRICV